jgi:hypothetical protein
MKYVVSCILRYYNLFDFPPKFLSLKSTRFYGPTRYFQIVSMGFPGRYGAGIFV